LFEYKKSEIEQKYGLAFSSPRSFWQHVEGLLFEAKYIRDVANASKHVNLTRRTLTSMSHIANTVIQTSSWSTGPFGSGRYSDDSVKMKDGGSDIDFDDCVEKLRTFRRDLIDDV